MKLSIKLVFSFFYITLVSFSFAQQRTYTIYYEECENCNSTSQAYTGIQQQFSTYDIVSDFGRRRGGNSKWHKGVDYNLLGHDYVGDHLFSVFDGAVKKIIVTTTSQYKIIIIDAIYDLGYGHIFEYGEVSPMGMKKGDMVLKKMTGTNQNKYAIINLTSNGTYL